jgi:hypothetical protein
MGLLFAANPLRVALMMLDTAGDVHTACREVESGRINLTLMNRFVLAILRRDAC